MPLALAATSIAQSRMRDDGGWGSASRLPPYPSHRGSLSSAKRGSLKPPMSQCVATSAVTNLDLSVIPSEHAPATSIACSSNKGGAKRSFLRSLTPCKSRMISEDQQTQPREVDGQQAIQDMLEEEELLPWYVILPSSNVKHRWDLFILGLVMLTSYIVPLDIAYRELKMPQAIVTFIDGLDIAMLVFFVIDCFLSFFVSDHVCRDPCYSSAPISTISIFDSVAPCITCIPIWIRMRMANGCPPSRRPLPPTSAPGLRLTF